MPDYIALILIFAAIGVANTLYLSWHTITKKPVKCLFFPEAWCQKVQGSKQSRTLGIPNSFAGLGFYTAILVLTWLYYDRGGVEFWWIQALIAVGFVFAAYFTFVQAFILRAFCTWCVVSAIDFTILGYVAFLMTR